jgi:sulfur-oxidizing protein SoxY
MTLDRRKFLEHTTALSLTGFAWMAGLISPRMLEAKELDEAFAAKTAEQLIPLLADRLEIRTSNQIELKIPDVAENGAIVPITITSSLNNIHSVAVIAEMNPVPLIGRFILENGAEAFIQARIKMAESSHIIVLVNADDQLYRVKKFVRVTVGGCGS